MWNISFIRVKPGMDSAYTGVSSRIMEGQSGSGQEGRTDPFIIKVIGAEGHTPADWNLMLMTEYKDLASMEANEDKADALAQKMVGNDQKQMQGYKRSIRDSRSDGRSTSPGDHTRAKRPLKQSCSGVSAKS